jgi:hypothetical protein
MIVIPSGKDIVINYDLWKTGIAESPHVGMGMLRNVDIYSTPGVLKINYKTQKESGTTVTGLVKWMTSNPVNSDIYALDADDVVYKSTDDGDTWAVVAGNTKTSSAGNGALIWKNYLLVARNTALDAYGPLDGVAAWTSNFVSMTSDDKYHPMLHGQDDIVYIGAGRYVHSLEEVSGSTFDPTSGATFTSSGQALDLPSNYRIKTLSELGQWLEVGTWQGTAIFERQVADVFPWDRSAPSFRLPLTLKENGINQSITDGTQLIVVAGTENTIYKTDGSSVEQVNRLRFINTSGGVYLEPLPGAIMKHQGRVFFGVSHGTGGASGGSPMGVYSLQDKTLVFENEISTGNDGSTNTVKIGALYSASKDTYLIGWQDNTSGSAVYGIDRVVNDGYYTLYAAYIESPFFKVGTDLEKRTFQQIYIELDRELAAGQGIRVKARSDLNDAWTTVATFDFATFGAIASRQFDYSFTTESIEFKVELTSSGSNTPALREVRVR